MASAKNVKFIGESVLSATGNTPMVRLRRLFPSANLKLYAKLEMLNPGGSVKDRAAFNVIRQGTESGKIKPNSTVIESSSGNMGIGLLSTLADGFWLNQYANLSNSGAHYWTMREIATDLDGEVGYLILRR